MIDISGHTARERRIHNTVIIFYKTVFRLPLELEKKGGNAEPEREPRDIRYSEQKRVHCKLYCSVHQDKEINKLRYTLGTGGKKVIRYRTKIANLFIR